MGGHYKGYAMPIINGPKSGDRVAVPYKPGQTFAIDESLKITKRPDPPEDLDDEGVLWWNYYTNLFVQGGFMSKMFLTSFHNLCIMHMIRNNLMIELGKNEEGIMLEEWYVNKDKEAVSRRYLNPLVKDLQRVILDMDKLLATMGMTPYTSKVNQIDATGKLKSGSAASRPPAARQAPPQKDS